MTSLEKYLKSLFHPDQTDQNKKIEDFSKKSEFDSDADYVFTKKLERETVNSTANETGRYLYVFADELNQICKIGISKDPKKRLQILQTGYPHQLKTLFTVFLKNPDAMESIVHKALNDFRLKGEWFYLDAYYLVDWSSLESFKFEYEKRQETK